MKQFICRQLSGEVLGPYDLRVARAAYVGTSSWLDKLDVGMTVMGGDSAVWERLPDLASEPQSTVETRRASDMQAERLERIATAALQGLITGVTSSPELGAVHSQGAKDRGFTFEQYLAMDAVGMAKALIAELDKQS